jgi:hypothetical protein
LLYAGGRLLELPPGEEKLRGELDGPRLALPLPAQGGRLLEFSRVLCGAAGRFELPKPCGARPESVELPWAFQARPEAGGREALLLKLLFGREPLELLLKEPFGREVLLLNVPLGREFCGCTADGGRLVENCDGRELLNPDVPFAPRPKFPAGRFPP